VVRPADLPEEDLLPTTANILYSAPGLPIQRNAALDLMADSVDIIAFFDDDYIPSSHCIEEIEAFFSTNDDVAAANGFLIADGINSEGISYEEAMRLVSEYDARRHSPGRTLRQLSGLYGCNMVYRNSAIGAERFDENLPLYAWQEDIDFAARVGTRGRLVLTDAFAGVHQGVKGARLAGVRLGYSQIANPIYLMRKGTLGKVEGTKLIVRNMLMNHARALLPEPWVDRLGRCKGNWLGIFDLIRRKDRPDRVLSISS
jgi:hypothetical protein